MINCWHPYTSVEEKQELSISLIKEVVGFSVYFQDESHFLGRSKYPKFYKGTGMAKEITVKTSW